MIVRVARIVLNRLLEIILGTIAILISHCNFGQNEERPALVSDLFVDCLLREFLCALGIACCLPTAFLLLYNGLGVGAFVALYASRGLGFELGGWLLIHGVTELFAITLAGGGNVDQGRRMSRSTGPPLE